MDSELPEHTGLTKLIGRPTDHSWKLDAEEKMRRLAERDVIRAAAAGEIEASQALSDLAYIDQAKAAMKEYFDRLPSMDDTVLPSLSKRLPPIYYSKDVPEEQMFFVNRKDFLGPLFPFEKVQEGETEKTFEVSPTGGRKETKLARYSLIPAKALKALAEVYGRGAYKYADHNWRRGYKWSASHDALLRHIQAFWDGELYDPESGQPHIMHAAWHCFTLFIFSSVARHARFDDRFDEDRGETNNSDMV